MKTTAALVTFSVLVAFVWRLTERLQDDSLAMLLGFGAGIVVLVIVVVSKQKHKKMEVLQWMMSC